MWNNPILNVDPDGRWATPPNEYDQEGNKISNLGGDKIDFYHQENGNTKIVDRASGASNIITGGESLIRGYVQRDKDISWTKIAYEWDQGEGPANSIIADFDNTAQGAFGSLDNPFSSYASLAREDVLSSGKSKDFVTMTYRNANPLFAKDMWEQMWGRTRINWYKLGDKTLFLMTDSKSMTSFGYRLLPSWKRSSFKLNGTTHQTYIWTKTSRKVQNKVNTVNQKFKKILRDSRNISGFKW